MIFYQTKFNLLNKKLKFYKFLKFFLITNKSKKLFSINKISLLCSISITKTDIKQIFLFFLPQYNIKTINSLILKKKNKKIKKIYLTFKY